MKSRLFHAIVVCGASLGAVPLGCAADAGLDSQTRNADEAGGSETDARAPDRKLADRCFLPDGGCNEHCNALAEGGCLDPCFVHTSTCSPDCLLLDGSCGWPPTK
jgi:hypothetical protein